MPLTRGEAVGYNSEMMVFEFAMRNGKNIVRCEISRAALGDLAGGWTKGAARDLPAEFEAHRELIEAIASAHLFCTVLLGMCFAKMRTNLVSSFEVWSNLPE